MTEKMNYSSNCLWKWKKKQTTKVNKNYIYSVKEISLLGRNNVFFQSWVVLPVIIIGRYSWFLAVLGWRVGVFYRVPTLCNQLLPHNFRQTFFKPCTDVMDTLKISMWLFGSVRSFSEKFTCSWTSSFFQHVLNRQTYFSRTFRLTLFKLAPLLWFFL
jgi:hypothetical protein